MTRQVLTEAVNLPDLSIPRELDQLGAVKERWSLLSLLFLFHLLLHLRRTESQLTVRALKNDRLRIH